MADATMTNQDKMNQKENWSLVPNSPSPHTLKDSDLLRSLLQLGGIGQKPHDQIQGDMRFVTTFAAYPDGNLMESHLAAQKMPKRFICNVCGIGLTRKEHLDRHQRSHTDERPYSCGVCSKTFKRSEHLTRHSLIHLGRKAQKLTSASNSGDRTIEVITLDSDDEVQQPSNLNPVPDKPKNTCNNSDNNVIPKYSDITANPSLSSSVEPNERSQISFQCDSVLPTNLAETQDTESDIKTEFITCDNDDQFVQHCDEGATSGVQCYNLLIGEALAPDIKVMVDPVAKNDPDEMDRKDIWSERPAPDMKFMLDPVTKTDPDEMDRKDIWSERPATDINIGLDAVTKTDPDQMDQKGDWSMVSDSSVPPIIKDTDYLSSLLQMGELDEMPHKSEKQRKDDVRFVTFSDGTQLYFCPKCQEAYPDKKLLEHHLVAHKTKRRFICNVCGAGMKRKEHLDRHQLSHSDERPYSCGVCSKTFKRSEHLSRHSLIHLSRKAKNRKRASRRTSNIDDKNVEVNTIDPVGEDKHSSNVKPVSDKPENNSGNSVIRKETDVTDRSLLLSVTELTEQIQKSYQCGSLLLSEAVDTENEMTQTEFGTCYKRVFDDHVRNLCTKMGDLIFLSVKEEGSYKQRVIATDKITCERLREKEKKILKTNFLQVNDKYKISFATMFHDVVSVILSNASTVELQKILLLSWFLKLFLRITTDLLPEHSDSPLSIWKKIIDMLSNYENPSPMVEGVFSLNEVDFEKECWKTLDLAQQSFC